MNKLMIITCAVGAPETARAATARSVSGLLAGTALVMLIAFNPLGGAVLAQTPDTLCVNPAGQVRLVQGPGECRKNETAVSLNGGGGTGSGGDSKSIFVSSTTHTGNLGGLGGADMICNNLAASAGLTGVYRAWLSSSLPFDDPASTFVQASVPYVLPNGVVVATDWADLTDGRLLAPISVDENGQEVLPNVQFTLVSNPVWTNTDHSGTRVSDVNVPGMASFTCFDFTSDAPHPFFFEPNNSGIGTRISVTQSWTNYGSVPINLQLKCELTAHLYCVQQ